MPQVKPHPIPNSSWLKEVVVWRVLKQTRHIASGLAPLAADVSHRMDVVELTIC